LHPKLHLLLLLRKLLPLFFQRLLLPFLLSIELKCLLVLHLALGFRPICL
jgi:hypothetical protein